MTIESYLRKQLLARLEVAERMGRAEMTLILTISGIIRASQFSGDFYSKTKTRRSVALLNCDKFGKQAGGSLFSGIEMDITHRFIVKDNKDLRDRSGIYAVVNKINNHLYIGKAINLSSRKSDHFTALRKNCHYNKHLQRAFNLYGGDNFQFVVIEFVKWENLSDREQFWIFRLSPVYNIKSNAYNNDFVSEYKKQEPIQTLKIDDVFIRPEWHRYVYAGHKRQK